MTDDTAVDFSRYEGATAGPWGGVEDDEGWSVCAFEGDRALGIMSDFIASVVSINDEADARLIADAPLLLSALRQALAENGRKDELLREARALFAEYALSHMRKDPPDRVKAERNSAMARKIDAAFRAQEDAALTPPTGEAK
jgi:hypothetical protein